MMRCFSAYLFLVFSSLVGCEQSSAPPTYGPDMASPPSAPPAGATSEATEARSADGSAPVPVEELAGRWVTHLDKEVGTIVASMEIGHGQLTMSTKVSRNDQELPGPILVYDCGSNNPGSLTITLISRRFKGENIPMEEGPAPMEEWKYKLRESGELEIRDKKGNVLIYQRME